MSATRHQASGSGNPARLLDNVAQTLKNTYGTMVEIVVRDPGRVPCAETDAWRVERVLIELALSACGGMSSGGSLELFARIHRATQAIPAVVLRAPGDYVVFGIRCDAAATGPRARGPASHGRTACPFGPAGLRVAEAFCGACGGDLRLNTNVAGALAELFLPVAVGAGSENPQWLAGDSVVLVVEDDSIVRNVAACLIRSLGYRALTVGNAEEALEALAGDGRITLVFTDIVLGAGMNGVQLAAEVRKSWPHVAMVLTTGYDNLDLDGAMQGDGYTLLRKPYLRKDIGAALDGALTRLQADAACMRSGQERGR